jgi:acetolactate synthase-1/2/3 large subunit
MIKESGLKPDANALGGWWDTIEGAQARLHEIQHG